MDVFLHIPKASGTTIRTIVSREYGAASIAYYEPETETFQHRDAPEEYLRSRLADGNLRLITGHLRYGIHEFLRRPCRYFSMLRDPIERALSEYFYAFSYPAHRYRDAIVSGGMSFSDFLAADALPTDGALTHFLAGWYDGLHTTAEVALFNLAHSVATVGTSERFDESMLLIARDFGWRPPLYLRRNVTRLNALAQDQRRSIKEDAHASLLNRFSKDYAVYNAADDLLSTRVRSLGADFQAALENFRELQIALSRHENPHVFDEYNLEQDDELPGAAVTLYESSPYRQLRRYLQSDPIQSDHRRSFVGYFDGRSSTALEGWAMDMSRSTPITVTLRHRNDVVGVTSCSLSRPDVAATGFPSTPCGFRFHLNPPTSDFADFTVCFEDTSIRLRR